MTITVNLYDTRTLLGVWKQLEAPSNYWLDLCFPSALTFDTEYVDFEKVVEHRKLAPLVVPTVQGKPIYRNASKVTQYKPAYIKPKDPINPNQMIKRAAGEMWATNPLSPQQRYDAMVANIMQVHRNAIERRWEWMAAEAAIKGTITLTDEDYPTVVIDFQRDAGHTVLLGAGATWDDPDVDIIEQIEGWQQTGRRAKFGGAFNRITMGIDAWDAFRQNNSVKRQLDLMMRGTTANFDTGVGTGANIEYKGKINSNLDIYVYNDYYEDETGSFIPYMDSRNIVLTGDNVQGVRAFGAILDVNAQLKPLPVFTKMWNVEDPSATFVMSQSAPLMIPVNPNNTFKVQVLS